MSQQGVSSVTSNVRYEATLTHGQKRAIELHISDGERNRPLVFRGREEILAHVARRIERLAELGNTDSTTVVLHGPPGAGKTSLLAHIEERFNHTVVAIPLNSSDFDSKDEFIAAVLEATGLGSLGRRVITTKGGWLGFFGFLRGVLSQATERLSLLDFGGKSSVWGYIKAALGTNHTMPLMLCVDESQNLSNPIGLSKNALIEDLQLCNTGDLSVMPIYAGLSTTVTALEHVGLSRLDPGSIFRVGPLERHESEEVIRETLSHERFGLTKAFAEQDLIDLGTSLAIAGDNWPRHLTCYVNAVIQAILDDQQLDEPTMQIDMSRALEIGHTSRIESYGRIRTRFNPEGETAMLSSLYEVCQEIPRFKPFKLTDWRRNAEGLGVSGEEFSQSLRLAKRIGLVESLDERDSNDMVRIPIPSLQTYLSRRGNFTETLELLREDHHRELAEALAEVNRSLPDAP